MKKIITIVAAVASFLVASTANAQLGINAGYAPQTYTTTVNSNKSTSELDGFFAGVNYSNALSVDLGLNVGLQFRYNTHTDQNGVSLFGVTLSGKATSTQMLLDIPVLFNYSIHAGALRIAPFVGPTFSYALSGKTEFEGSVSFLGTTTTEYDWYGDNTDRRRLDISLTFGISATYNDLVRLYGGYSMGLMNLTEADNTTLKGSNWFVGAGILL